MNKEQTQSIKWAFHVSFDAMAMFMIVVVGINLVVGCSDNASAPSKSKESQKNEEQLRQVKVDPIEEKLATSLRVFNIAIAQSERSLQDAIDERILSVADTGDLDAVKALQDQKQAFVESRSWPADKHLVDAIKAYRNAKQTAYDEIVATHGDAIKRYTKQLEIEKATGVRTQRDSLLQTWEKEQRENAPELVLPGLVQDAVLIYSFDEQTRFENEGRAFVRDLSPRGNHGLLVGAGFVAGKVGQACLIDRPSLFIESSDRIGITGNQERTVGFWLKDTIKFKQENHQPFMGWGVDGNYKQFRIATNSNSYGLWAWGRDWSPKIERDENWHFHSLTYDGKVLRWYIDGENTGESWPKSLATGSSTFKIGGFERFELDELVVLPKSLDDEDIKRLYELSKTGFGPRPASD